MGESQEQLQCAIVYPRAGKADRLKEIMNGIIASMQENEPNALQYQVFFGSRPGGEPIMIVLEKYKNQEALHQHRQNPKLAELRRVATEESLFAHPPEIIPLSMLGQVQRP
ncbi:hypothetical protein AFCA_011454 [Aspergillus flavus]|uniref:Antibiotic biosynthesis monooxygenase n=1 Tax=Aspergillus oryzae TaxID=5062 RepID=A0A1S9DCP4_ASPOZ|nr:Antibiotic biosynthesis monooxygenase [Aspergillus oryzae]UDD64211.1 hypothetical protein AFCA_011454 [Aspergillus flavus]